MRCANFRESLAARVVLFALAILTWTGCSPWPIFHHDVGHTGLSQFDTSGDKGVLRWRFPTSGRVESSPAIAANGTILVGSGALGSESGHLYGINPDGTEHTRFTPGAEVVSSPTIAKDGSIYVGADDDSLDAFNSDGTLKWSFFEGAPILSSPAIGSDGTIYIGSDADDLLAVTPAGGFKWAFSNDSSGTETSPAIGADGTIYVVSYFGTLYAVNPDGSEKWGSTILPPDLTPFPGSSPAIGADGTIYAGGSVGPGNANGVLYAINPDGTQKWIAGPWVGNCNIAEATFSIVTSTPAIGKDGTVYVGVTARSITGPDCGGLWAISADGFAEWSFTSPNAASLDVISSPAIGKDGTIYFGSAEGNVYALNPDGSEKWSFTTGDSSQIISSPAIGPDGTVYVGSDDSHLYAIH